MISSPQPSSLLQSNALRDPTPPGTLVSGADHAAATASSPAAPEGDAFWTPEDDEPEVWVAIVKQLAPMRKRGAIKDVDNTKSHFRNMKGNWNAVWQLLQMSGFGWDSVNKRVTAEDSVWDQLLNSSPKFKKWRHRSLDNYERLDALCAKSTATGNFARDGKIEAKAKGKAKAKITVSSDDDDGGNESSEDSAEEGDKVTPSTRKRKRPSTVGAVEKIAAAVEGLSKTVEDGLTAAFEDLLEVDGDAFTVDELARLGTSMANKPTRFAVYRSFRKREEHRRAFLRQLLEADDSDDDA
ncbi:hypothetical protein OC842_000241 [Tilletia horrida]|uniref:Myb/SANT-like domain-containing protein n=1 Tax=Tilletia horrida TaxID=155126 RepID=A0AAN6JPS4_9BASI|nr:hypothetical protein OC842_000241 [Tilletia horrida]